MQMSFWSILNFDSVIQRKSSTALPEKSGKGCCISSDQSVSRVLSDGLTRRDGHFSRSTIARTLQQPTRGVLIEVGYSRRILGLAPAGVCHATGVATRAVGSYPTISPLPLSGRFAFCCTFRHRGINHGAQELPGSLAHGARTFLELVTKGY